MNTYFTLLTAVLPIFTIIATGWVLRKLNWLTAEADASLLRLTINVVYPCFIFRAVLGNEMLADPRLILTAPLIGFVTVSGGCLIALWCARLCGLTEPAQRRTFAFTVGIYNFGYMAIPVTEFLFGRPVVGVLSVYNLGVEIGVWTVCLAVLTGASPRRNWRKLINPPILAVVAGLVLNFSGAGRWVPRFVTIGIEMLGASAIPLALILIGATVADFLGDLEPRQALPVMTGACLLRLLVLPAGFLVLAFCLPLAPALKQVIIVQAAMPTGTMSIVLSKHYGGDPRTALRIALSTSVVALLTIPFWLHLGLRLLGSE